MSRIEVKQPFLKEIPYFPRRLASPPQEYERLTLLSYSESLRTLTEVDLTPAQQVFLSALLQEGSVKQFPGGLGLDYDYVFKRLYYPQFTREIIEQIAVPFQGKVDAVLMPERSAIIPGVQVATALGKEVLIIRLEKNGNNSEPCFAFQVDSYTGGGRDTISVQKEAIVRLVRWIKENRGFHQPARVLLVDEIIDTGAMARGVGSQGGLVGQCCQEGLSLELSGVAALMEKTYTQAAQNLQEELRVPVVSGLQIEDLWLSSSCGPGIKISGIEYGFSFRQQISYGKINKRNGILYP